MRHSNLIMDLRMFDGGTGDGGQTNAGGQGGGQTNAGSRGTGSGATYTYEQAEQIAAARAEKAERAALAGYFRQQGLTEEQVTTAISDFKKAQAANRPDVGAVTRERDEARAQLQDMKNQQTLTQKGVRAEDLDYVLFKVNALVDDKTDFAKAADNFLRDNPRYAGRGNYRFSNSTPTGSQGSTGSVNSSINDAIRARARR